MVLQNPWVLQNVLSSLRVAVPTPQGKMGGRERLRKAGTNCLCDVIFCMEIYNGSLLDKDCEQYF